MSNFSEKMIEEIKSQGIHPEARWKHILKRSLVWISAAGSVAFGILAIGIIILSMTEIDEHLFSINPVRFLSPSIFFVFPPLWVVIAGLSFAFAIIAFRNTRHGYRHQAIAIAGIVFFLVITGAFLTEISGLNRIADSSMKGRVPGHPSFEEKRVDFWSRPEDGFLSGEIITISPPDFSIRDFSGGKWYIHISEETRIRPMAHIIPGTLVKISGDMSDDGTFEAEDVRPWEKPRPEIFEKKKGPPESQTRMDVDDAKSENHRTIDDHEE